MSAAPGSPGTSMLAPTPARARSPSHLSSIHTAVGTSAGSEKAPASLATNGTAPAPAPPVADHGGILAATKVSLPRFWTIFAALLIAVFLFALDQLIIATAIPAITAEFRALTELPWLANGFFMPLLAFNLVYAQWGQVLPSKVVLLFAVFIFEAGSLVCGIAPNMRVLILGRAISGVGAAGIFSGGMVVVSELVPMRKRPQYLGLVGVSFALASVLGPLLGGAFSDHVSWRWCFYINLPFGGLAMVLLAVFQPMLPPMGREDEWRAEGGFGLHLLAQLARTDWGGIVLSMGWAICMILFMQWGGIEKPWRSAPVIVTLVVGALLTPAFFLYEYLLGRDLQMCRLDILVRRTVWAASLTLFFIFGYMMIVIYYLSVHFQSVYKMSATDAGVRLLPFILPQVTALIVSSRVVPAIGRFKPVIMTGPVFMVIGAGLLYSVPHGASAVRLYGYQVLCGLGVGMSLQNCMVAVQVDLMALPRLVPAGFGICTFLGFAGRILGISLAGSVFGNMLRRNLVKYAPSLPPRLSAVVANDARSVWTVPAEQREGVLHAYTDSLRAVYVIAIPFALGALLFAACMENLRMPTKAEEEALLARAGGGAGGGAGDAERGSVDEGKRDGGDSDSAAAVPRLDKDGPEA